MEHGEESLAEAVVEDIADDAELTVGIAESVAMGKVEHLIIYLQRGGLMVEDYSALFLKIAVHPDVVVAAEVVDFDAQIGEFADLTEEACVALWHGIAPLVPEIEHIAEEVDCLGVMLDGVEEAHKAAFLHTGMIDSPRPEVGVGEEIDFFHLIKTEFYAGLFGHHGLIPLWLEDHIDSCGGDADNGFYL